MESWSSTIIGHVGISLTLVVTGRFAQVLEWYWSSSWDRWFACPA